VNGNVIFLATENEIWSARRARNPNGVPKGTPFIEYPIFITELVLTALAGEFVEDVVTNCETVV